MPAVSTAPTLKLSPSQKKVADDIVAAGRKLGATNEEIIAAISAGYSESGLNPSAVGDNGLAIGVFQQHPSYGDTATRQNVATAATAFIKQLIGLRSKNEPIGTKVADVQRPAAQYRNIYTTNLDEALSIYNQVAGSPYSGTIADLRPSTDGQTSTDYAGNPISTDATEGTQFNTPVSVAPGVYKALDRILNDTNSPSVGDLVTDPLGSVTGNVVSAGRVLIARGAFAVAGITVSVFGLILVVGAVQTSKTVKGAVGTVAGPVAGTSAGSAVASVAEAVPAAAVAL